MASTSRGSKRFNMMLALSGPSMTSSAASFCVLFKAPPSGAALSDCSRASSDIRLRLGTPSLVHPFADGLGHVGRIFLNQPVQDIHADDAGDGFGAPVFESGGVAVAGGFLSGHQAAHRDAQLNVLHGGALEQA